MTSLIIIYFLTISIQRAVSFLFCDFPYLSILAQQIFGIFMPACFFCEFVKKQRYIEKKDLKIKIRDIPIVFSAGFCMQFFGSFVNFPIILILSELNIEAPKFESVPEGSLLIAYIFLVCILPAIFEEILFRKITFLGLMKYGKAKSLIATAIIFGVMHFNLYSLFPLILAGLMLTYMVYNGFPLIYTILFHFSLNFSGIIFDFITRNPKINEIIDHHFLLLGIISGFLIFAFAIYIKKHSLEESEND